MAHQDSQNASEPKLDWETPELIKVDADQTYGGANNVGFDVTNIATSYNAS